MMISHTLCSAGHALSHGFCPRARDCLRAQLAPSDFQSWADFSKNWRDGTPNDCYGFISMTKGGYENAEQ